MKLWEANLQVYKKTLSHILLRVFCLHFLRMHHDYFDFESVLQNLFQEI